MKIQMEVIDQIKTHINGKQSFVLEAGAGAGKTYTLIQSINHLLLTIGYELQYNGKQIVCITYTNVAKNEIIERLENNPLIVVATIHEFLWDTIKPFQEQLLKQLDRLNEEKFNAELEKKSKLSPTRLASFMHKYSPSLVSRVGKIEVQYIETSYRDFEAGILHHDDVLVLSKYMFEEYPRLSQVFADKYPYLFVDEYQDTANEVVQALLDNLLQNVSDSIVIGFFGDSHQKIYDSGVGSLEHYYEEGENKKLELVTKSENYRSAKSIIELLNKIRDNIQQKVPVEKEESISKGLVRFIDGKAISETEKNNNYNKTISFLEREGWDFKKPKESKILMLANRRIAKMSGFGNLFDCYSTRYGQNAADYLFGKEDRYIRFLIGSLDKKLSIHRENGVEHLVNFFEDKDYIQVMNFLRRYGYENSELGEHFQLKTHKDKARIYEQLEGLKNIVSSGTIGEVLEYIRENNLLREPDNIAKFENSLTADPSELSEEESERQERNKTFHSAFMNVSYSELKKLNDHALNTSPFSTKHGTKGEEYKNVLFVIDDDHRWHKFKGFDKVISGEEFSSETKAILMNNLFYVCCSRAVENLVVLGLSNMDAGKANLNSWFGEENVYEIENLTGK